VEPPGTGGVGLERAAPGQRAVALALRVAGASFALARAVHLACGDLVRPAGGDLGADVEHLFGADAVERAQAVEE